jgi:hypothetical protein
MPSDTSKIEYRQMRLDLPDGAAVVLWWPANIDAENVQMLREVFELQMKAHLRSLERKTAQPASGGKA